MMNIYHTGHLDTFRPIPVSDCYLYRIANYHLDLIDHLVYGLRITDTAEKGDGDASALTITVSTAKDLLYRGLIEHVA